METWMVHGERTMAELSRLCTLALDQLAPSLRPGVAI
jgi:hypothetical protein